MNPDVDNSVPIAAAAIVIGAIGVLVLLTFLFKGNVHF